MHINDTPIQLQDVTAALRLLSRLPLPPALAPGDETRGARAAWAYPLAGLILGGLSGAAGSVALWLGLPTALAALVMLATLVIVTGALHEDGLADTVDGFWGGWTAARRLEIMRDSHIGSYGVIALILSLGARWGALWGMLDLGLDVALSGVIVAAMLSRAMLPALMWALPRARTDGLSHHVGRVPGQTVLIGLGVAAVGALGIGGGVGALIVAGAVTAAIGLLARARIGGQTGDVLGATQQMVEIALLCTLLIQT